MSEPLNRKHKETLFDAWERQYRPLRKLDEGTGDEHRFETYGTEWEFVKNVGGQHVWTVLECDGKMRLVNGLHTVNRVYYFVTEVPWKAPEEFDIPL